MTTASPALALPDNLIALIRRDERRRCLEALRGVEVGPEALLSRAYLAGHTDTLATAQQRIEQLPIEVSLPAADDEFLEELLG